MLSGASSRGPWSNVYGVARSVLATGLLLTLCFTDHDVLFDARGLGEMATSPSWLTRLNLFVVLRDHLAVARLVAIVMLAVVASGWRPRFTALGHWWVAFSFALACQLPDGGDHVHVVLATLLVGVAVTDPRRWHWQPAPESNRRSLGHELAAYIGASFLVVAAIQMSVVYFHASIGKMPVAEWANGTATYYWFTDPSIGAPAWIVALLDPILGTSIGVLTLTWGTLALELTLAVSPLLPARYRHWLLIVGLLFHTGIILIHGLVSFFFSMAGGLVLLTRRHDQPFTASAWLRALVSAVVSGGRDPAPPSATWWRWPALLARRARPQLPGDSP